MPTYVEQPIVVGNTANFEIHVKLNGVIWNIASGAATLYIRDRDGNLLGSFTGTVTDGIHGIASCTVDTTTFDVNGTWSFWWKIETSGIVKWTKQVEFDVYDNALSAA